MKRRTWRRWPSDTPAEPTRAPMPPSQSRRFASRGKGKAPEAEACPVCGSPLRVDWMVEEGPHGCRRVRLLRCPDDACPRSRLGEGAG